MPSQTSSPGTIVNDASHGSVQWRNPGNAAASDDLYADTSLAYLGPVQTNYLKATNFGFTIPAGMTITGIKVEIERKAFGPVVDNRVRLVKAGVVQSTDKASSTPWPSTDAYVAYGGDGDTWGDAWAVQDINDSGFGVVLAATVGDGVDTARPFVDHIQITVYYTESSQHVAAQSV
jgi:hypothetical protein